MLDHKSLSDRQIDAIYELVYSRHPDATECDDFSAELQAEIDKQVRVEYPQRAAFDRRIKFATDNDCDI